MPIAEAHCLAMNEKIDHHTEKTQAEYFAAAMATGTTELCRMQCSVLDFIWFIVSVLQNTISEEMPVGIAIMNSAENEEVICCSRAYWWWLLLQTF